MQCGMRQRFQIQLPGCLMPTLQHNQSINQCLATNRQLVFQIVHIADGSIPQGLLQCVSLRVVQSHAYKTVGSSTKEGDVFGNIKETTWTHILTTQTTKKHTQQ